MDTEFLRALSNAWSFYCNRLNLILVFSIPFIIAYLLLLLVAAPTFVTLGATMLRTVSIPDLSYFDIGIAVLAYLFSFYIIAASIVNVNLVVRSKRTLTQIKDEVITAMGSYAVTIFYVYTIMLILTYIINLLTYESGLRTLLYPLATFLLSFLLFFVPPAVVIDHEDSVGAIKKSVRMALRRPHFVILWSVLGLIVLMILKVLADLLLPGSFAGSAVLLLNSLFVLPFLIIFQTQLYMEKYPLAR